MGGVNGRVPRLIVGISRSRASWWALAWAIGEARRRGAQLLLVHVYRPSLLPPPEANQCFTSAPLASTAAPEAAADMLIWAAINQAVGRMPADVAYRQLIVPGRPAVELASLAYGGDILVLGARRRGWLRRLAPGSVAGACAQRSDCPVVTIPEPSPSALRAALPADVRPAHRHRWGARREPRLAS